MNHTKYLLIFSVLCACSTPVTGGDTAAPDSKSSADTGKISDALKDTLADADEGGDAAQADTVAATNEISSDLVKLCDTAFSCFEGEIGCINSKTSKYCVNCAWQVGKECGENETCNAGKCLLNVSCTPKTIKGCTGYATQEVCNAAGNEWVEEKCPGIQQCAAGKCRDVVCTPGFGQCVNNNEIKTCLDDGSGFTEPTSCKSSATCLGGKCLSLCESNIKVTSNVGCEYWSVDLDNSPDTFSAMVNKQGLTPDMIPHSIIISNPGLIDAELSFEVMANCPNGAQCSPVSTCGGKKTVCETPGKLYALPIADKVVKAGDTREFKMPVMNIDGSGISPKAIHVKSTQPVVAFQFNPFDSEGAASNDGSLLLPVNALGKVYYSINQASTPDDAVMMGITQGAYVTVVAVSPGTTQVQVVPRGIVKANAAKGVAGANGQNLQKGQTYTFTLKQYDVLNLGDGTKFADAIGGATTLTGTRIEGDKALAVFSGHEESVIGPDDKPKGNGTDGGDGCCAEHLEEQMMPVEAWGNAAFCVKSKPRGSDVDEWIVVAGEDNLTLTTVPSIKGADGIVLKNHGDSVRFQTNQSFFLSAKGGSAGKIQVAQFLISAGYTDDNVGDPSMAIVPPSSQYRNDYVIRTADGYGKNWTSVVRPKGVEIKVDGAIILDSEFSSFGDGSWEFAYHEVGKGTHVFESKSAFGLMVYGYGNKTAYSYPGGMNLK